MLLGAMLLGCPAERVPTPETAPVDLTAACCVQCRTAASQDPQAMDLTLMPCAGYAGHVVNGRQVLEQRCAEWFGAHPVAVGECPSSH
jgi:hypothetical protein